MDVFKKSWRGFSITIRKYFIWKQKKRLYWFCSSRFCFCWKLFWDTHNWNWGVKCFSTKLKVSESNALINKIEFSKFNPLLLSPASDLRAQFHFKLVLAFLKSITDCSPWKSVWTESVLLFPEKKTKTASNKCSLEAIPRSSCRLHLSLVYWWVFFFTSYLFVKLFGIVISDKIPVLKQFYGFRWAAIVAATMKHKYC